MKTRRKGILIAIAVLLVFVLCFLNGVPGVVSVDHARLIYSVRSERFESVANRVLEQGSADEVAPPVGVKDLSYYATHSGCVDFEMGGFGLVPSSTYWGIVYTVEDVPVGWSGVDLDYNWDGNGWYWQEETGDNHSYVTKLDDHWYLYQMWF